MPGFVIPTTPDTPQPLERVEDISPAWMTSALRSAGFEANVSDLTFVPIGTGQMADSFRVELVQAPGYSSAGVPHSVVMKMQAADELSRQAGAGGAYNAEVRFYMDLAPTLKIRTPDCYYAVGPDVDCRFALVLEDMAPAEQGDQLLGCDVDAARAAVVNLAGLHGPRWCDPALLGTVWHREPAVLDMLAAMVRERTQQFVEHYGERVAKADVAVLEAFAPLCGDWLKGRSERFAPVHGDYRLDNLLFGTNTREVEVTAVDWQTLDIGLPARDLGYFLGNSLLPDERRRSEQELVSAYHQALTGHGVTGYSLEDCFEDYRFGQFQGLMITVLAAAGLSHTERGDDMFMAMSSRACEAIRDLDSLELL
jgi:hypothetical protein